MRSVGRSSKVVGAEGTFLLEMGDGTFVLTLAWLRNHNANVIWCTSNGVLKVAVLNGSAPLHANTECSLEYLCWTEPDPPTTNFLSS